MTHNKEQMQSVNYTLVGVFIVFVVFIFVFFSKTAFQSTTPIPANTRVIPTVTPTVKKTTINFDKPVRCAFNAEGASYSAQIDDTSVAAVVTEQKSTRHMVVNGDCLYQWINGETTGTKRCGMLSMIALGKQLVGSGIMSLDTIVPGVSNPLEQCANVGSIDKVVFTIPQTIRFIEAKPTE